MLTFLGRGEIWHCIPRTSFPYGPCLVSTSVRQSDEIWQEERREGETEHRGEIDPEFIMCVFNKYLFRSYVWQALLCIVGI